jgi:hypothetical protein
MTDTWDDDDRAIARALGVDAPPGAEADADAISEYETVLGALPFEPVAPRPGLEHEVVAAALARRPAAARAIGHVPARARRSTSLRWVAIAATAAAAAAIALVLAVGVLRPEQPDAPGGHIAAASATGSVAQVLAEPGTRTAALRAANGTTVGRVALSADGQGYLYDLTPAADGRARLLWLDTTADPVRVGLMPTTRTVHFVVRGDVSAVRGVFVTADRERPAGFVIANAMFNPADEL